MEVKRSISAYPKGLQRTIVLIVMDVTSCANITYSHHVNLRTVGELQPRARREGHRRSDLQRDEM